MSNLILARHTDPDTSHLAADSQAANLSELQRIILGLFEQREFGFTDDELGVHYGANQPVYRNWPMVRDQTPRKRRSELTKMGLLEDSGVRRPNRFGALEIVWVAS